MQDFQSTVNTLIMQPASSLAARRIQNNTKGGRAKCKLIPYAVCKLTSRRPQEKATIKARPSTFVRRPANNSLTRTPNGTHLNKPRNSDC